jgi:hypothetical protein
MDQKPIPRDPHSDTEVIEDIISDATPGQSDSSGGRVAHEVATRDEGDTPIGADPEPTRAGKGDKRQPFSPTQGGVIGDTPAQS